MPAKIQIFNSSGDVVIREVLDAEKFRVDEQTSVLTVIWLQPDGSLRELKTTLPYIAEELPGATTRRPQFPDPRA
jgi:hypothetical protein